jgi:Zn-dependent peptidase ImmA (M78 family)
MAKFRLRMATQHGEKIASEFGFTQFPVRPRKIAEAKEIGIVAKSPEAKGISGAIIFAGDAVNIIYSTEYDNLGFENFSIAHELGHYFLEGHPDEILKAGGTHLSRSNFTQNTSIELEADHFASGLLLPSAMTKKFLSSHQLGIEGIKNLASKAECSVTAAAIRAAECSAEPLAIIVSEGERVCYAFTSDGFKNLGNLKFLPKGTPLPDSGTRQFNSNLLNVQNAGTRCTETDLHSWFEGSRSIKLDEEILGLGAYGLTLTVLSSEALPEISEQDEDEDAALERSWTPRFAYGR